MTSPTLGERGVDSAPPAARDSAPATRLGVARARQALTIARIELRRAFFARRSLWVYALALLPPVMFFGHGLDATLTAKRLSRGGVITPALIDSVQPGAMVGDVRTRLGTPAREYSELETRRVRRTGADAGTTTHVIEPTVDARIVRLNVTRPSYDGEPIARIYEFEVYGPDGKSNLALQRPAIGSPPCTPDQGPAKAVNGSVAAGQSDAWCGQVGPLFLQVDLGAVRPVTRFVVKHASAGGEREESDTRDFNIQLSTDGKSFTTVVSSAGARFVEQRIQSQQLAYFDGRREARFYFADGKLQNRNTNVLLNLEEDRTVFAGIFQYFYLRVAIFFGSLGIFMNLFRAEMSNRTLHFWLLAPARREVLLAGKYAAGLLAAAVIFGGGAVLTQVAMIWPHDPVEVQAYWNAGGMGHIFWYAAAAVLGCVGYGSVFLAVGLYVRNPIIPAALLLGWEAASGVLPQALQRMSILYYLQSLCPVPAPMEAEAPTLLKLLAAPAAPASRPAAILGLLLLSAFVLWIAAAAVRRMEIAYGAEGG